MINTINSTNISSKKTYEPHKMVLAVESFILFCVCAYTIHNWISLDNANPFWIVVRIIFSLITLMPIGLAFTEWGMSVFRHLFGMKNIGLKFCCIAALLIGLYILFGKLSYKGFYLLLGIEVASKVYKFTPFALILIFEAFFLISNIHDRADFSVKIKISDLAIPIILVLFITQINYPAELQNSYLTLFSKNLQQGILAGVYFVLYIYQWLYLSVPLVIFLFQRNFNREKLGLTLHFVRGDVKYLFYTLCSLFFIFILTGFITEKIIYVPFEKLTIKLLLNKIYFAIFLSGVTEEFLFRGLIYNITRQFLYEKKVKYSDLFAMFASSLLYGLSYIKVGLVQAVIMTFVGFILNYVFQKTGKLSVPILGNAFWKVISLNWVMMINGF